jgi:hypothetical protein
MFYVKKARVPSSVPQGWQSSFQIIITLYLPHTSYYNPYLSAMFAIPVSDRKTSLRPNKKDKETIPVITSVDIQTLRSDVNVVNAKIESVLSDSTKETKESLSNVMLQLRELQAAVLSLREREIAPPSSSSSSSSSPINKRKYKESEEQQRSETSNEDEEDSDEIKVKGENSSSSPSKKRKAPRKQDTLPLLGSSWTERSRLDSGLRS